MVNEPSAARGPVVDAVLTWAGDLRFEARGSSGPALVLDGDSAAGPSPVMALVAALAGCMAMDVVHVLSKARLAPTALTVAVHAERASADPRRVVGVTIRFDVRGDVPPDRVAHAIELSRETYCSVWHSLREDIPLETTFEVRS